MCEAECTKHLGFLKRFDIDVNISILSVTLASSHQAHACLSGKAKIKYGCILTGLTSQSLSILVRMCHSIRTDLISSLLATGDALAFLERLELRQISAAWPVLTGEQRQAILQP
jgi:hypothetical protein